MEAGTQSVIRRQPSAERRRPLSEPAAREAPSHAPLDTEAPASAPPPPNVLRWLPLSLLASAGVLLLPVAVVRATVTPVGLLATTGCAALAAALSLVIAKAEALLWQRRRGPPEILFADLMLWGLARRWWTERRLSRVRACYENAACTDSAGRIELLEGVSRLLEARSAFTNRHCRRVARHAERIARGMHLSGQEVARIRTAALVHDVGKVYTPLTVLHKPGPLTDEEYAIVKRHAADGADMLAPVRDAPLATIVRHHHERIDGSGYPDGLAGEQIPVGARIIAVADTFDAITSQRPYRRARSQREAMAILSAEAGAQLDQQAVESFLEGYSARRSVASFALLAALLDRIGGALFPAGLGLSGSAAQVLPAIGAAGLLAVSPGVGRYERSPLSDGAVFAGALAAPFPGVLGSLAPSPGGPANTQRTGGANHRAGLPRAGSGAPPTVRQRRRLGGGRATLSSGSQTGIGSPGAGSTTPIVEPPIEAVKGKLPGTPKVPRLPSETPEGAGGPPVTPPPITLPPVKVPPISTPPISTPPVNVPPVGTVPEVKVAPVGASSGKAPGVKLP